MTRNKSAFICLIFFCCFFSMSGQDAVLEITRQWDQALNNKDTKALTDLYADEVVSYGQKMSKATLLKGKAAFFKRYGNFSQSISELNLRETYDDQPIVLFDKQTVYGKQNEEVYGYLLFDQSDDGQWKIVSESDFKSDSRLRSPFGIAIKPRRIAESEKDLVFLLAKHSKPWLEKVVPMMRLGARIGYMFTASPNPTSDIETVSDDYKLTLSENNEEWNRNFMFLRYDPIKEQLFELDLVDAEYVLVEFDRDLLKENAEWAEELKKKKKN